MMRTRRFILCLLAFAGILGCGPAQPSTESNNDGDISSGSGSTGVTTSTTDPGTGTEEGVACDNENYIDCDGECVYAFSDENCGECGHACVPYDIDGHCEEGRCSAVRGECIAAEDGFATCGEYCASIGELCGSATEPASHPCHGTVFLFETNTCSLGGYTHQELGNPSAACDWPIPFGEPINPLFTGNSARCCCTQHGGE